MREPTGLGSGQPGLQARLEGLVRDRRWTLESERLDLVPLRSAHAERLFPLLQDSRLYEFTGGAPPPSLEFVARWFTSWETRRSPDGSELWLNWLVEARSERKAAIGYVQATVLGNRADLAWVIGLPWQRRGYASEAARALRDWLVALGAERCRACVRPGHVASQAVARGLGMWRTSEQVEGEDVWILDLAGPDRDRP